jgi:hypothetical protein
LTFFSVVNCSSRKLKTAEKIKNTDYFSFVLNPEVLIESFLTSGIKIIFVQINENIDISLLLKHSIIS